MLPPVAPALFQKLLRLQGSQPFDFLPDRRQLMIVRGEQSQSVLEEMRYAESANASYDDW